MKSYLKKRVLSLSIWGAVAVMGVSHADDTEIYISGAAAGSNFAKPKVMLMLDYRSNLGSSYCSNLNDACRATMNGSVTPLISDYLFQRDGSTPIADGTALTELDLLRAILAWLFPQLDEFEVGFMINHDNSNNCEGPGQTNCSNGAYVLNGFTDIGDGNLLEKLFAIPNPSGGSGAHTFQAKEAYFELYRYLSGGGVYNGHNGFQDYGSSTGTANLDDPLNRDGDGDATTRFSWDTSIENATNTTYESPYDPALDHSCAPTYAITLFEGVTNQDDDSDDAIEADLDGVEDYYNPQGNSTDLSDLVSWMSHEDLNDEADGDQSVSFYFVADGSTSNAVTQAVSASGSSLIDWGEPSALAEQLLTLFRSFAVQSSTLVASSVPVNVFNRSDIQGDVYLAVFEVDDDGAPSWPGNLKKFRIGEVTTTTDNGDGSTTDITKLAILDVDGDVAISDVDGRIVVDARSYWTDVDLLRTPDPDREEEEPDAEKDGRSVTRGGAGHRIVGVRDGQAPGLSNSDSGARQMYFDPVTFSALADGGNTVTVLSADYDLADTPSDSAFQALKTLMNLPAADDGDDAALDNLRWLRGYDTEDADNDYRTWTLADVLHSKPLTLNYGARDVSPGSGADYSADVNPDIRIFMGTNDGFMRQFQSTAVGSDAPSATDPDEQLGAEIWSFMPRELLDNVYTLRKNLSIPDWHPYGVDGPAAAFVIDNNGDGAIDSRPDAVGGCSDTATGDNGVGGQYCDKAYIYFGLRRGGNSYYALDVSNPDDAPTMLWSIKNPLPADFPTTLPTGDFAELGMSFSAPRTAWVKYEADGEATPVLIFGGGYYGGWQDSDNNGALDARVGKDDLAYAATGASPDPVGAAIYIVHARTGALIWKTTHGGSTGNVSVTEYNHADMHDSIPSEVATLDSDGNGITDRIYVGDTGGTVWRIDLEEGRSVTGVSDQRSEWFASRFANLADSNDKKLRFFHRPDIVSVDDGGVSKHLVVMGSGDRAHPRSDALSENKFFVLKDDKVVSGDTSAISRSVLALGNLENITNSCVLGSETGCVTANLTDNGWVLDLEAGDAEKNLGSPVVIEGKVLFTSYAPGGVDDGSGGSSCSVNVGESLLYAVSLANGAAVFNLSVGNLDGVPDTKVDRYMTDVEGIGSDPVAIGPKHVLTPGGTFIEADGVPRWDVYWREQGVDSLVQ